MDCEGVSLTGTYSNLLRCSSE
ncbi:MAG: hypothetical protein IJL19_01750 [Clostridiales bacterium]|nr:hypothetical protein [Clostridiales bacterium]